MTLAEPFERAGCLGFLHACTMDGVHEIALDADEPVMPASVIKVLIAVEVETQMAEGRLDPTQRVRLGDAERTPGPVGMSLFEDEVEISLRDLVTAMLTISDNVATDALLARVGLDAVNGSADRLGMTATHLASDLRTMVTSPDTTTRTTARDMTRLLRAIWTDDAGPPQACRRIRNCMTRQLTRSRLAGGFGRTASVAAKSGGLRGMVRNEIGVVSYDDAAYAVAVFTRSNTPQTDERAVNAAIGEAAADAVGRLRQSVRA